MTRREPHTLEWRYEPRAAMPSAVSDHAPAITRWAAENPCHAAWLAAGAPPIRSDAQHREWFGEPYTAKPRRVK